MGFLRLFEEEGGAGLARSTSRLDWVLLLVIPVEVLESTVLDREWLTVWLVGVEVEVEVLVTGRE